MAFVSPSPFFTTRETLTNSNKTPETYSFISPRRRSFTPCAAALQTTRKRTIISPPAVDVFAESGPNSRPRRASPPRPVVIVPGYAASASHYEPMAASLRECLGEYAYVSIVPLSSRHWMQTIGGKPVTAVLQAIDTTVQKAVADTGVNDVSIVAHSAGGWISRIYLGDETYPEEWLSLGAGRVRGVGGRAYNGEQFVGTLLCLGTPHTSKEPVARHNVNFVNDTYPGAYFKSVRYLNFAGDGGSIQEIRGKWWKFWHEDWFSTISYKLTNGRDSTGTIIGDGIVPMNSAFLENAHENILLKGVRHAPASRGPWYGHPRVVEYWSSFLR